MRLLFLFILSTRTKFFPLKYLIIVMPFIKILMSLYGSYYCSYVFSIVAHFSFNNNMIALVCIILVSIVVDKFNFNLINNIIFVITFDVQITIVVQLVS